MKKLLVSIILIITPMLFGIGVCADAPSDLKGVWVSTVHNLDFPQKATADSAKLKSEIDKIVSDCADVGYNAIFLQVRPSADSIYPSSVFPWSRYLTGKSGQAPDGGFDPLAYWVEKCHSRSIELHAWINPYRVTVNGENEFNSLAPNHPAKMHPDWVVKHTDGNYYFNPGIPEVINLVVSGAEEILRMYKVDGIHMDDYFYPGPDFEDEETFRIYNVGQFADRASWRRDNVNQFVKKLHSTCGKYGKVFGISPSGIWDNKSSNPLGSDTRGRSSYRELFADSRTWVINGWVDYLAPQIYWEFGYSIADYEVLAKWWSNIFSGSSAKLYIGLGTYRGADAKEGSPWYGGEETKRQMDYNRQNSSIDGEIHFRYKLVNDSSVLRSIVKDAYAVSTEISAWSKEEVEEAIHLGIVPEDMQNDYKNNITRAEFAKIAVMFVARHFDMDVDDVVEWYLSEHTDSDGNQLTFKDNTFTDIDNSEYEYYIKCANSMHIIYGRGDGIFDPNAFITREEAATVLLRVYFCYGSGVKLGPKSEGVDAFCDVKEISSWADSAVRYMYQWDVMKGVSDVQYSPKSHYTKEQCYITFLRLDRVYSIR